MLRSPILAFFSPPASPTHTPLRAVPRASTMQPESQESNVALFTHQDGQNFEVTIVRFDDALDLDSRTLGSYRQEEWDSDDWDEDAEDWAEPAPQQRAAPQPPQLCRHHRITKEAWTEGGLEAGLDRQRPKDGGANREGDRRVNDDWDGDAEDLEERPVAKWSERPERPDLVRRVRDADVWRTRLGED